MGPDAMPTVEPPRSRAATAVRQVVAVGAGAGVVLVWVALGWTRASALTVGAIGLTGRYVIHPLLALWERSA